MFHFQQLEKILNKEFRVTKKNEVVYESKMIKGSFDYSYIISDFTFQFNTEIDHDIQQLINIIIQYNTNTIPLWHRIIKKQSFDLSEIPKCYLASDYVTLWMIKGPKINKDMKAVSEIFNESVIIEISSNILLAFVLDSEEISPEILVDHFETELMKKVKIVVGPKVSAVQNLAEAYDTIIILDQTINTDHSIVKYEDVLIEFIVANLDMSKLKSIFESYKEIYPVHLLTPELIDTIYSFFEHSLNVTDTANVLFLHRNTLIYRLNKILQLTNLDIRKFEDASKMKILLTIN